MVFALAVSAYGFGYPIFFKEIVKIPNYYFGFLGSISALMGIFGAFLGEKLSKKKGYYFTISLFAIILLILYLIFGISSILWFAFIIFMMIELLINSWHPIFQSFFNKFIPSHIRASILSLDSSATLLIIAIGNTLFGFLLTFLFNPNGLIIYGGILFILIPFLLLGVKTSNSEK
jgi:MFS family permease